jgi:hypothetical protein
MSVFDAKSRYLAFSHVLSATDRRGRTVTWVTPARVPAQTSMGLHRRKDGDRLDRLSAHYLNDPFGYWRITAMNDANDVEAIADLRLVDIPQAGS